MWENWECAINNTVIYLWDVWGGDRRALRVVVDRCIVSINRMHRVFVRFFTVQEKVLYSIIRDRIRNPDQIRKIPTPPLRLVMSWERLSASFAWVLTATDCA